MPVVSATREAEAGGALEPRRLSLQWAVIMPLNFCLKKKKLKILTSTDVVRLKGKSVCEKQLQTTVYVEMQQWNKIIQLSK